MKKNKKVKRKLNIKAFVVLLLFLYIIGMLFYTFFTMPIKNIYIKNTNFLSDNEIIEVAGIKDYPSIFKTSKRTLINKIKSLELVNDVKITKKINGTIIIDVVEASPLFYNRNTNKVVLSNGKEVENSNKYLGIPTLINYVPIDLLKDFITSFKSVHFDIINMINEIEYDPDISEEVVIDDSRFFLRMNDGNHAYVNILNMKRLNNYKEFYMLVGDKKGTLYLDSYDSNNDLVGLFTEFGSSSGDDKDDGTKNKLPE